MRVDGVRRIRPQGAWRWSRIRLTGAAGLEGQLVSRSPALLIY